MFCYQIFNTRYNGNPINEQINVGIIPPTRLLLYNFINIAYSVNICRIRNAVADNFNQVFLNQHFN